MEFATWAYPWDILDEGPAEVEARLRGIGIDEVNLATNYHTVQAFTPHNPERRTLFARASSYFETGPDYGQLEPMPYEGMDGDWVADVADGLTDLTVTSWTVGCHNSRLGMDNPGCTLESAHGDDLVFGLCPSNPEVQRYLTALVSDLASRDGLDRIELETFDYFYGTGFGWHHQKIHARLGPLGEFFLGLCFCPHCRENATDAGVDVGRARTTVAETLDAIVAGDVAYDRSPEAWLTEHSAVAAYVDVREQTLTSLYAELADAAGSTPLGYYVGAPEPGREWMVGADLAALSTHVDYYCLPAYESTTEAVLEAYRTVESLVDDIPLHVGLLPGHPAIHDEATVVDIVRTLESRGVPRLSFYNYGLLPEQSLQWVGAAIDAVNT
ncbi:hypothetical protein [Haloarcula pellucida]|uniref:Uncharacterized protein n=1 Tax=Haloarcula pellucida TaxID=1427151 RepID=A0A830GKP9_9EURY|nr:hypothetical protein [Halomicroarcula pellucida]MBX0349718.1 hypothetical protein [Halomicroarcula pellucida]GGN93982.1 hypothetical protein GCM10009030_19860 [Halomicroarcula pellucida]